MKRKHKFLLASPGGGTDLSTVKSVTTLNGIDVPNFDSARFITRTIPSFLEVYFSPDDDTATIGSVTTPQGLETGFDNVVITTYTTLISSYVSEVFTISTRDYNFVPWDIRYIFDGSIPISGDVGTFDDDLGEILLTPF